MQGPADKAVGGRAASCWGRPSKQAKRHHRISESVACTNKHLCRCRAALAPPAPPAPPRASRPGCAHHRCLCSCQRHPKGGKSAPRPPQEMHGRRGMCAPPAPPSSKAEWCAPACPKTTCEQKGTGSEEGGASCMKERRAAQNGQQTVLHAAHECRVSPIPSADSSQTLEHSLTPLEP